jgi:hypothetical protein
MKRRRVAGSARGPRPKPYHHGLAFLNEMVTEFGLLFILGTIVAIMMIPLLHLEAARAVDRVVGDLVMREIARDQLETPPANAPRLLFIDINEETCRIWAEEENTSCTLGMITPRDHLGAVTDNLLALAQQGKKPLIVVLDVELAPSPRSNDAQLILDDKLCASIYRLSQYLPVVAVRPMTIGRGAVPIITAFPSIFDPIVSGTGCGGVSGNPGQFWFASPILHPDEDGVIRSIHAWDTVFDQSGGTRLGGIGFLTAALLNTDNDRQVLACDFPASAKPSSNCQPGPVAIGGQIYEVNTSQRIDRLSFLLPYENKNASSYGVTYGNSPSVIDIVDARKFEHYQPSLLVNSVLVLGGSYLSSGDLHATPLEDAMPGAMVHANAIRTYATSALLQEKKDWLLKFLLVIVASFIGSLFHAVGRSFCSRLSSMTGDIARVVILFVGTPITVSAVFLVAVSWASTSLAESGTVLGTLTPALAVALESLCGILHELKQFAHELHRRWIPHLQSQSEDVRPD